ncbi:surface-adhesin E family protein [Burkholderia sp. L27(2015)]|uniref:surface-adhesin E family protein n=1 Tax=Burkholderia sp. L27(2015) TaxID=1641858 RepID=UPI00131C17E8|nr:surface-adhesin E family protein [Burkholderia sp. L27(2015)]
MTFRLPRFASISKAACIAGLAAGLSSTAAWADSWTTIGAMPNTAVQVSIDFTSIIRPDSAVTSWLHDLISDQPKENLTHAWFLFDFPAPVTTAESFVYRSYKRREIIDCERRASAMESYVAYSDPRADGRVIYTWTGPNAVVPQLVQPAPGSIAAIMIDAACTPPAAPLHAAATTNGAAEPANTPINDTGLSGAYSASPGSAAPARGIDTTHRPTQELP